MPGGPANWAQEGAVLQSAPQPQQTFYRDPQPEHPAAGSREPVQLQIIVIDRTEQQCLERVVSSQEGKMRITQLAAGSPAHCRLVKCTPQ